jgi:hypothetical protein
MKLFKDTYTSYMVYLLNRSCGKVDPDWRAELDAACDDLEQWVKKRIKDAFFYEGEPPPAIFTAEPAELISPPQRRLVWFDGCLIDLEDISAITATHQARGFDKAHFSVYLKQGAYMLFSRDNLPDAESLRMRICSAWMDEDQPLDLDRELVSGTWTCQNSPTGNCRYDDVGDPVHDSCIYCGYPEERK